MSVINGGAPKGSPQRHYTTMTTAAIAELDIVSAEQAHLYLWALASEIEAAYRVCRAWGFAPLILWTWAKPGLGVGRFRCNTEHVIVARKGSRHGNPFGSGGRYQQATAGTVFHWPRGRHSEKPDAFYELVERLSPPPYLELFARRERAGWRCLGDELGVTLLATSSDSVVQETSPRG